MPERTEYAPGTPSWVDLQTPDQAAAKSFYGELFGWKFDDAPIEGAPGVVYSMASVNGKSVGAIAPLDPQQMPGVPPHWNTYVTVSDVESATATIAPAGGTVIAPPFDVMDAGRMSVVQDPTGAIFNLWQPKNNIGAELVNEPGAFCWNELLTPDVPKAAEFYNKVFGWTANTMTEPMPYTEFRLNDNSVGGAMNPPMPGIPPVWTVYFAVGDTDATVAKAQSLGGAVFQPPTDIPPGRFAVLADPQGAMFNVLKLSAGM